jgi:diguanylate cyclase (GGDEF)-like protein
MSDITNEQAPSEAVNERAPAKSLTRRGQKRTYKRQLAEISETLGIDLLTGLPTRIPFTQRLQEEAERIKRIGGKTTILFLDADKLKLINDSKGHEEGDKYLASIAEAIKIGTRRGLDYAARYGGDEFVLILPNTDLQGTETMWNESLNPEFVKRGIAISAGAALLNQHNPQETIKYADRGMYGAKHEPTRNGENLLFTYVNKP